MTRLTRPETTVTETPSKSTNDPADNPSVSAIPIQSPTAAYAPPGPLPPALPASPLGPEHLFELAAAQQRQKKVLRATSVAAVDAWLTAIFAALTLISGLFGIPALLLGLAMSFVAFNSFRGARLLKRLDPRAATLLGFNQIILALSISAYAGWTIYSFFAWPQEQLPGLSASDAAEVMKMYGPLLDNFTPYIYGAVIVSTWIAQGLTALYYFTRRKHIESYVASTPQWIHDLQRAQQS